MVPVTYAVQSEKTSPMFAAAFARGCGGYVLPIDAAIQLDPATRLAPGPMAAFGTPPSWPLFGQAAREGRDWYYGDHGLFSRFRHYRVTKNRLQPDGRGVYDDRRWTALHVDRAPAWKTDGRAIVVCPQSPVYMGHYFGLSPTVVDNDYVGYLTAMLQRYTDRPIIVRFKTDAASRPLRVDLQDAWMVVAWSSATAVEALAAGVPICTLADWASTAHMGIRSLTDLETPYYPDLHARDQFLFNLANQQWTLDEIASGLAWRALNP